MQVSFGKLTFEKGQLFLQFTTDRIVNINPKHFIQLTRPRIDLSLIENEVRKNYKDEMVAGLFTKELEEQMQREIKTVTDNKIKQNLALPKPTIFVGRICEVKHKDGTILKMQVSPMTAMYFIKNYLDIGTMVFDIKEYPYYLSDDGRLTTDEARKALAIKDAFIAENPESIEMEDCFDILVKHIEQVVLGNKDVQKYVRPTFTYTNNVLYVD